MVGKRSNNFCVTLKSSTLLLLNHPRSQGSVERLNAILAREIWKAYEHDPANYSLERSIAALKYQNCQQLHRTTKDLPVTVFKSEDEELSARVRNNVGASPLPLT